MIQLCLEGREPVSEPDSTTCWLYLPQEGLQPSVVSSVKWAQMHTC